MNKLNIHSLKHDNVEIFVEDRENSVSVNFSGMIDMRDPSTDILPFLTNIHNQIVENNFLKVFVDFSDLFFMNSSGIKTFISWIMKLDELPENKKYKLIIIYNPDITWQESSIQVINRLFPEFIEIYSD